MRLYTLGFAFLLSACSDPAVLRDNDDVASAGDSDLPAGSIQISITQLEQLDDYGCKVYLTAKNTNAGGERTPFIQMNTEAISSDGIVLSTGQTGISNVLPERTVNRQFLLNDVQCSEIDHFKGLSGESEALAPSPDTKMPIEM